MIKNRKEILEDVLVALRQLAEDWEFDGAIGEETLLLTDIGLASLDLVVLANAAQQRYDQALPFPELFAELGQKETRDVSVGEWADFICEHLNGSARTTAKDPGLAS